MVILQGNILTMDRCIKSEQTVLNQIKLTAPRRVLFVPVVAFINVNGKQLRSCPDSLLLNQTVPGQASLRHF